MSEPPSSTSPTKKVAAVSQEAEAWDRRKTFQAKGNVKKTLIKLNSNNGSFKATTFYYYDLHLCASRTSHRSKRNFARNCIWFYTTSVVQKH